MAKKDRLGEIADLIKGYISLDSATQYYEKTGVRESDFVPIIPEEFEGTVFAIDGSNVVIFDLAAAKVNYIRAGYVAYKGRKWQKTEIANEVFVADQEMYAPQFEEVIKDVFGLDEQFALEDTELDRLSSYFRELQEYVALFEALENASEGDLVLYDGGFAYWKEKPYGKVLDRIFRRAEEKGADILGISKSSTFSWNNGFTRSFVQDTNYIGSNSVPNEPWHLDLRGKTIKPIPDTGSDGAQVAPNASSQDVSQDTIEYAAQAAFQDGPEDATQGAKSKDGLFWKGRIYVAKFHPLASRAFRVDAPWHVVDHVEIALGRAACYSDSAECLGYPHALFRAHRDIRITDQERRQIWLSLLNELGVRGVNEQEVRGSLDYHEVLEMRSGRML